MSDPWQYRVRVTGPDRDAWWKRARAHRFGRDLISWPMTMRLPDASTTFSGDGTWYNVRTSNTGEFAEFFGNYSQAPGPAFSRESRWRVGPALFDGLDITVEIVGHTWHNDSRSGVYSYRDVLVRGVFEEALCEKADDSSVAEKYAPELLVEFPDLRHDEEDEDEDPIADPVEAEIEDNPPPAACRHGVPFEDPLRDNGCQACADETRAYLHGLVRRPVS